MIIKVATFDLIPTESATRWITDNIFKTADEFEIPDNFSEFGYNSTNTVANLQFVFFFMLFITIVPLLLAFLKVCIGWNEKIVAVIEKIKANLYWNFYLRFIMEAYMELSIAHLLKLVVFKFSTVVDAILTVFSLTSLLLMNAICFWSIYLLHSRHEYIRRKSFSSKYGSLTLGL